MDWTDNEIERLRKLIEEGLSHSEISKIFKNRNANSIRLKCQRLKIFKTSVNLISCKNCKKDFHIKNKETKLFCSKSCSASFNNKTRIYKNKSNYEHFCECCGNFITGRENRNLKFCSDYCRKNNNYISYIKSWKDGFQNGIVGEYQISPYIRKYLFEKHNNKCSICHWGEINTYSGKIPLEVEHIDGNFENNLEDNLTLLCPNCHSLTSTYKSLNKNGRKSRSKYKI